MIEESNKVVDHAIVAKKTAVTITFCLFANFIGEKSGRCVQVADCSLVVVNHTKVYNIITLGDSSFLFCDNSPLMFASNSLEKVTSFCQGVFVMVIDSVSSITNSEFTDGNGFQHPIYFEDSDLSFILSHNNFSNIELSTGYAFDINNFTIDHVCTINLTTIMLLSMTSPTTCAGSRDSIFIDILNTHAFSTVILTTHPLTLENVYFGRIHNTTIFGVEFVDFRNCFTDDPSFVHRGLKCVSSTPFTIDPITPEVFTTPTTESPTT